MINRFIRFLCAMAIVLPMLFGVAHATAEEAEAVQALINQGQYDNAFARVEQALKKDKKSERLMLQRGFLLVQLNRLKDAKSYYKKLIRRLPKNAEPSNNLGVVYRMQGQYADAINQFKKTLKKFPDYGQAYENLGDVYIQQANIEFERGAKRLPLNQSLTNKAQLSAEFDVLATQGPAPDVAEEPEPAAEPAIEPEPVADVATAQQTLQGVPTKTEPRKTLKQEILDVLRSWTTAWTNLNSDNYLAHYSQEFTPGKGLVLSEWVAIKRESLNQISFVKLVLNDIKITPLGSNQAEVRFIQDYQSDAKNERSIKVLNFKQYGNLWLIVREQSRLI